MKILGLIPARCGSKGIPNKNIKLLNGKPLIAYTIEQAQQSKLLTKCIVTTNSIRIANIARSLNSEVPFLRPDKFSTDKSPAIDYVLHALSFYEIRNVFFEAVCILQPTSPFRPAGSIDEAILQFDSSKSETLISVREIPTHYNPHWVFFSKNNLLSIATGDKKIISSRQALPKAFNRDGDIYITKTNVIKENKSVFGNTIQGFLIESPALINIDTNEDWMLAERYIK